VFVGVKNMKKESGVNELSLEYVLGIIVSFFASFTLVVIVSFLILQMIVAYYLFDFILYNIVEPLYNVLTPLGTIAVLALLVVVILRAAKTKNTMAAASYLPGMGAMYSLMFVIRKEEDEFVKFHATQGLVLFVIASLLFIISILLINLEKKALASFILFLLFIVGGLLLAYMMYTTYRGRKVHLF